MPLYRCDYSDTLISQEQLEVFVGQLLAFSTKIMGYSAQEGRDKISIFTKPFAAADHSTAAMELEMRVKVKEFDHPAKSRDEVRAEYMEQYKKMLGEFIAQQNLPAGVVFTITFEDWDVAWLPPASPLK